MRVLWFTQTPSLASKLLHSQFNGCGWIDSLEKKITKTDNLELGIAFHYGTNNKRSFEIDNTIYFQLPYHSNNGKLKKLWKRWMHYIEPDSQINHYMEVVEKFKPDIIHIFGTEPIFGLIIPKINIPVIIQIQGNVTICSKKWFSGLNNFDILIHTKLSTFLKGHGLWHYYYQFVKKSKREQIIFSQCKYFIGRTDWDKRIIKAFSSEASYFHCDELLRDDFYQNNWEEPSNQKIILFSTISQVVYKGLETILETASILKNKKFIDIEWQIAGISGDEEIIGIIEKTYKLKFYDQNITFKGSLSSELLVKSLLKANIFIHPSHIENSPNSVCEAMLLGVPVIATFAGGTPSIINDKKEGLLVQDGDPYALTGAIIELLEDRKYAADLGINAKKRAEIRHNPDTIIADLMSIYNSVISNLKNV